MYDHLLYKNQPNSVFKGSSFIRWNTERFTLWIIKSARSLNVHQHANAPVEEGQQKQGQKKANPDAQRYQRITVPFVAKSVK